MRPFARRYPLPPARRGQTLVLLGLVVLAPQIAHAQSYALQTVVAFSGPNGGGPTGNLLPDNQGGFYGTTVSGGTTNTGTLFHYTLGTGVQTLASFSTTGSTFPTGGLLSDGQGGLVGTTQYSNYANNAFGGSGTLFRYTLGSGLQTLATFATSPNSSLAADGQGNLYGASPNDGPTGQGSVFKYTPGQGLSPQASFAYPSGSSPGNGLISDGAGHFYGATVAGGDYGTGTIFEFVPGSGVTQLASFQGIGRVYSPLVTDGQGNFYGAASIGGAYANGAIFRYSAGTGITVLASLDGSDGNQPVASLLLDKQGDLFGTASSGGMNNGNNGTVFEYKPGLGITTLATFNSANGSSPRTGLWEDESGDLYGTTVQAGPGGGGTIFELVPTPESPPAAALSLGMLGLAGLILTARLRRRNAAPRPLLD